MPRPPKTVPASPGPLSPLDRLVSLVTLTLVVVVPLVWSIESAAPFREPKRIVALACWIVLGVVFLARNLPALPWRDPWWFPWVAVVVSAAISVPLSEAPVQVCLAIAALVPVALGWSALRQAHPTAKERVITIVIASGTLQALVTLAFLSPALRPKSYRILEGLAFRERWIGTMGNPGDVAILLVLPTLLAADRALRGGSRRLLFTFSAALTATVIAYSQSLSGTAALVVGVTALLWDRVPRNRRVWAVAAALLLATLLATATPLRYRVGQVARSVSNGRWMWVGSGRLAGYQAALSMLESKPLTGVGFSRYGATSFGYQSEEVLAARARQLGLVTGFGEAHNEVLQHAAETGLLGIALLFGAVVLAFRRTDPEHQVAFSWKPVLAAATVIAMVQFPLHLAAIAAQWLVLWAMAVPALPQPRTAPGLPAVRLAAVAVVTVLTVVGSWRCFRATVALQQGKALVATLRSAPASRRRSEIAALTMSELGRRRWCLPFSWDLELTLGNLAMLANRPSEAMQRFGTALSYGERPESRFNLGMALLAVGERAAGLAELEKAVRLNPAILRQVADPDLYRALRQRLDASGYGAAHPWIYRDAPVAAP